MKQRVYIDTSVVGGYFDDEFADGTIPFFKLVNSGKIKIIASDLLDAELLRAPDFVKQLLSDIDEENIERMSLDEEATILADKYIDANVVGKTSRADCQHIAMATVSNADVLVSWNFRHIVNLEKIRGYNGINYQNGYKMIEIRTPKEIVPYEKED